MESEPLSDVAARKAIRVAANAGLVEFRFHAKKRMAQRGITHQDDFFVLKGGKVTFDALYLNEYRYRVIGSDFVVIVTLKAGIVVVTVFGI